MKLETWYVIAALLSPVGFVLQDVVADAMTVEAVPDVNEDGSPIPEANWSILGGSSLFVVIALIFGISDLTLKKEIILLGSLGVIIYLMNNILGTLNPAKQREIIGVAVIVFVFRAMPTLGAGAA